MKIDRRKALGLIGLGSMAPAAARAKASGVAFLHGVASGDPLADRVILWTRVTPADPGAGAIPFTWVATPLDRRMPGAVKGSGVTGPDRDFTIKVDATGLEPGRAYSYSFTVAGGTSPTGQFRTLPKGQTKDVVLAVASCSLYPNGYFNAYEAISKLPRVDAVLHLGDYIYEYGAGPKDYGMSSPVAAQRQPDPPHATVSLADYRRRHAQYKTDPQLQAAHAKAAWIVVWDDHESANDTWFGGAENHHPEKGEGDWATRKAAAIRAYYEWMPIREPGPGRASDAMWRSFQFGDLVSLFMVETRMSARTKQLSYSADLAVIDGKPDVAAFKAKLEDPQRRLMGPDQEAWLGGGLTASVKAGAAWQVIGNQVLTARVASPNFKAQLGQVKYDEAVAGIADDFYRGRMGRSALLGELGLPYNLDSWDGYPADRQRFYDLLTMAKATPIVLAGDTHNFWANTLHDGERRVAAEFCTTAITSPGAGDVIKTVPLNEGYEKANQDVIFTDQAAKGFVLLTLTREAATAEMFTVSTIHDKAFETRVLKTFTVKPQAGGGVSELAAG